MPQTFEHYLSAMEHWSLFFALVRAIVLVVIGLIVARLGSKAFVRFYNYIGHASRGKLWQNMVYYTILIIFFLTALHQLGFNLSVLLGAAGIITVAIGFASQTTVSNLISGLFLVGEHPFHVGETILLNQVQGEVVSVGLVSTRLRTADNTLIRIPNETLFKTQFTNLTRLNTRRFDCSLVVPFTQDLVKLSKILIEVAETDPHNWPKLPPQVNILGFQNFGIMVQLCVWAEQRQFGSLKNSLYIRLQQRLEAENIQLSTLQANLLIGDNSTN